ncbi:eukaryotic translation initiation factor 4 gamma 3 isoform X1 [Drosophila nasuta]|uniref:eukaryotic translation initiation factor 4 gamma 3 isoform X1 n=1 Tax=Drosophila nasuta TaxID=42062 RepID=UPI00295E8740|nr:eukaryotic translation initiation factor 4 gamma 3 isoform X1 [Drosophila nasuta]XP_060661323.1 eukaryotic translation initiation factor 4 gamma 3 isoform X1 [Drosophila nasuta]
MRPSPTNLSTQTEISRNMQPQNMILPINKKTNKKYASTMQPVAAGSKPPSLPQHSTTQPQFQINKAYNVVSILKTTTTTNAQQSSHIPSSHQAQSHQQNQSQSQQSYANVLNHRPSMAPTLTVGSQQSPSSVICSGGNIMSVNSCQINTSEMSSTAIYNLAGPHRASQLTGASSGIIDSKCRFVGSVTALSVSDMTKSCAGNNTTSNNAIVSNCTTHCVNSNGTANGSNHNQSIITLANSHGLAVGTSSAPPYALHDKGLLGVVNGVNVSCIDNRKFDYKNSNLLSNSSFQPTQEFVSSGNNSSGNTRSNPQTGGIFRGPPPTSNAPRGPGGGSGSARHVHMSAMYPNVVLQQFPPFSQRQPTFPAPHIQYAPGPISYYPYSYLSTLPQQPPHSRSGVAVNTNVNINNSMQPVQPGGPNGPLVQAGPGASSPQMQLLTGAVQSGTNTVLGVGVGGTGTGQVGVPPMVGVGVLTPNVTPSVQAPPSSRRRHQHRLQIIDPATRKNILDDLDKNNSTADEYQDQISVSHQVPAATLAAVVQPDMSLCAPQSESIVTGVVLQGSLETRANVPCKIDQISAHRQDGGQTPVVSAMSDAPSVEILPTPQKTKSKKIPIVASKDESELSTTFANVKVDNAAAEENTAIDTTTNESSIQPKKQPTESVALQSHQQHNYSQLQEQSHLENQQEQQQTQSKFMSPEQIDIVEIDPKNDSAKNRNEVSSLKQQLTSENLVAESSDHVSNMPNMIEQNVSQVVDGFVGQTTNDSTMPLSLPHQITSHESYPDETDRAQNLLQTEGESNIVESVKEQSAESVDNIVAAELAPTTEATQVIQPSIVLKDKERNEEEEGILIGTSASSAESSSSSFATSLINYNKDQWSPSNPGGKKQYDREQLMLLREAKASRVQPEVKNVSILPHPNLMPLFMRNNNNNSNKRVQSMVGVVGGGGNRNNESMGGNFVGKQSHVSMSGVQAGGRSSMKGMIHVNLSLNQDVKLNETENAWRPRTHNKQDYTDIGEGSNNKNSHEKDELVRRVRGILNKLTPERFDTLVEEIIKLKIDTPDKMDEVIVLVFEKAIDEPNFSVSYARLCHRLISEVKARDERMESGTKTNLQHFRNALLDKTEREFTQNVSQSTAKEKKLQPIVDKIKKCQDPNEKAELEALLEEEERKIRRRSGGTVRFIGELFKISMLTGKIIYSCIDTLLNPHSEDMLECLCKLLTTVGAKFEQTPVNSKVSSRCYSLEKSISQMQSIASKTEKDGAKVSSRVRFMLQDVIDLRKNKWQSTRNEAPKTMGQIEKEAKNEQLSAQYMNYSGSLSSSSSSANGPQAGGPGGKRDDRGNGRFDGRSTGGGYGGSHSQRIDVGSNLRHQQLGGNSNNGNSNSNSGGGGGANSAHSNGNNDDNTWHVQTSKGSRSQAVDSNKLEGLTLQLNQNLDTKKMGGVSQFIWNNASRQSSTPTTTPSNSFAALSSLIDKNMSDRDRDRSGPRNKGSYNKGSMERDRYNDRGIHSRTGSSQGSRENSSSRVAQQHSQNRGGMLNSTSLQKSASHSKYTQQVPPARLSNKAMGTALSNNSAGNVGGIYRGSDHQLPSSIASSSISNSASQSRNVAPQAVFVEPRSTDLKLFKSVVSDLIDLATTSKKTDTLTVVECFKRISEQQRCGFLFYILTDYLHLANVDKQYRRYLANMIATLIQENYISVEHFQLAYKEFTEYANDLIVDIPDLWLYVLQFAGPLVVKKVLTLSDLWTKNLRDNPSCEGKHFLKTYLTYCTREVGPNFTRNMWKKFNIRWVDFMPDSEVKNFIESNRFEYVESELKKPVIEERMSLEKHIENVIEHIEHLIKEGSTADCVIDYSNGNIVVPDKIFIRGLTKTLCNFAIVYKEHSYKLEPEIFQKVCIPVLQRYIDSNDDLQLECLYAVQLLVHSLEHPRGLLSELFGELYDGYVIQKESLCIWRDSKEQSAGKGVAVKSLNPFFNSIFNDETN